MSDDSKHCPRCGGPLTADAPQGLCPRCLAAGLAAPTDNGTGPHGTKILQPAPALDAVRAAFPQLEVLELIGRGGMGVVYKARQKSLNRLVALKLLAPERVTDTKFAERFTREAQALARLSHPNIVTIHDFGVASVPDLPSSISQLPFYFLLMEFVDGVNLRQAMQAGRFTPEQALAIVPPVCEALQYAHERGIVHRDIKPENLLLDKDGRVKIADFGIAKMLESGGADLLVRPENGAAQQRSPATPETLATAAGTPQYMAPEQQSHARTDHRADIYSLGVVLYELLTGELPGKRLEAPSRKVQIDVRLDEIVLRALETKPELRYQTAGEFRTRVETIASTSGSSRREEAPSEGGGPAAPAQTPQQALYHAMGYRTQWGQRLLKLSVPGFAGFLGFVPGWEKLWGLFGFFGLAGVATLIELFHRRHLTSDDRANRWAQLATFAAGLGVLIIGFRGLSNLDLTQTELFIGVLAVLTLGLMMIAVGLLLRASAFGGGRREEAPAENPGPTAPAAATSKPGDPSPVMTPKTVAAATVVAVFFGVVLFGIPFVDMFRVHKDSAYIAVILFALVAAIFAGFRVWSLMPQLKDSRWWFKPLSVVAFVAAVPAIGLAVFFAANMPGKWNPSPSEALLVPICFVGALALPLAGAALWRIAGASRRAEAPVENPSQTAPDHALPLKLKVAAALFFVMGCLAVWDMAAAFSKGEGRFEFGVLGFPIGLGLLRRRRGWRILALVMETIALVPGIILVSSQLTHPSETRFQLFNMPLTVWNAPVWMNALIVALHGWVIWVLTRPPVRAIFRQSAEAPSEQSQIGNRKSEIDQSLLTSAATTSRLWHAPAALLALLYGALLVFLFNTIGQMPQRVAIHFNAEGWPDNWASRTTHLLWIALLPPGLTALFLGLARLVPRFPRLVNLPRRDYWLAPERRALTAALLCRWLLWLACLMTVFFGALHWLVLQANTLQAPRLATAPLLVIIIGFLLGLMIWITTLLMRFAEAERYEQAVRAAAAPRSPARWRKQAVSVALAVLIALALRTWVLGAYTIKTDALAPELPAGSRVLVWKLTRTFAPGDLIVYRTENFNSVGRVTGNEPDAVRVNRNESVDFRVPRAAIHGKVFSILWRGTRTVTLDSAAPEQQGKP